MIKEEYLDVSDFEQITVSTTVVSLTSSKVQPPGKRAPQMAVIFSEGGQWRYRCDGGDPTDSLGNLVDPGTVLKLYGQNDMRRFRAVRYGATDAILHVNYLGGEK